MKNLNQCILGVALSFFALTGCSNEEQLTLDGTSDAKTPLNISVPIAGLTKVGGVVSGSQFGDGASLGLFLTKEDGSSPYDTNYSNIEYVSSNSGQTWTATPPILLTGTKAKVYAYYPYNSNYNDITSIPIDVTENQDVMWATTSSLVYNANPTATLQMNHALSVIRFSLSKGDYSGDGNITSIKIKGAGMAKTGSLNAKTGAVTPTDAGTEIDLGATATLSSTPTNVEQLVIPTGSGSIQVTIQMDDKTFEATSSAPITPEQSKAYKFGLAFSDSKLTMSTVTIVPITEVTVEDMKPIV
ncbi:MAG: fimbrillin family protein, partial [Parabacteroides sp.]|nr:fimbrillin family protein [Parabacteroides sp.]